MKGTPRIGTVGELQFVVEAAHLIAFAGQGMPAVLCTPALLGFLEQTAREVLIPYLEPDENSVGVEIELSHLAPTPPGQRVTCRARLVQGEGKRLTFQLEARDEYELIARGWHQRQVIRMGRFARLVQGKSPPR